MSPAISPYRATRQPNGNLRLEPDYAASRAIAAEWEARLRAAGSRPGRLATLIALFRRNL